MLMMMKVLTAISVRIIIFVVVFIFIQNCWLMVHGVIVTSVNKESEMNSGVRW